MEIKHKKKTQAKATWIRNKEHENTWTQVDNRIFELRFMHTKKIYEEKQSKGLKRMGKSRLVDDNR